MTGALVMPRGAAALSPRQRWAQSRDRIKLAPTGSAVLQRWAPLHGPESRRLHQHPTGAQARGYAGADMGRTTADWVALSTSADAELYTSLRTLRNRHRQLVRDNEYARNALRLIINNVVGQGVGLQANVFKRRSGLPDDTVNDAIEAAWQAWGKAKRCHTAGKLSWSALQRVVMRGVVESGEILIRKVRKPFGKGNRIPFALELIEADQLADNWSGRSATNGNEIRMGIEVDEWQRPVAYWLYPRHPGDNMVNGVPASNEYQRVPADEIIHIGLFDRPGQTRCVPWFHSAMVKLRHMGGYEEAEIVAARASAAVMGFVTSPEVDMPGGESDEADDVVDGERVMDMAPGLIKQLAPGEEFTGFSPTRPNAALDPFMRYMLRSVAAGIGVSYESLSRDYSQSNYSSSRLALLDDRDQWRILQQWLIETLHQEVFEEWLNMAVLSGTVNLPSFETAVEIYQAPRWQPRGWDWVDPAKEVAAAKASIRAGFQTVGDVIAGKGGDVADVFRTRRRELDLAAELELVLDTDPAQVNEKGQAQGSSIAPDDGTENPTATDGSQDDTTTPKED